MKAFSRLTLIASLSTVGPIESISHCRMLAGNPCSESPCLPINNYDESLAFREAIETLSGADVCAQHDSPRHRRSSAAALDKYHQSSSDPFTFAHRAIAGQQRITTSPHRTHHGHDQD